MKVCSNALNSGERHLSTGFAWSGFAAALEPGSEWLARLAKDAQVIDQDPTLANLILAKSLSDSNQSQNQRNRRVLALRLR